MVYHHSRNATQTHSTGDGEAEMEDESYSISVGIYDDRYRDISAQMPGRAERVLEVLVERAIVPPPQGSEEAPVVTVELVQEILEVHRELHGGPALVFENAMYVARVVGVGRRVLDVQCVREVILRDVEVNNDKVLKYEEERYFPDRVEKIVAVLRDNGVFPSGQKVSLSWELIRAILAEDMRLAQAGDVAQFYKVYPPRDEGEVERMSWEVWEYFDRQGTWKDCNLSENVSFVEGVLYHSSLFLREERLHEQWEWEEQERQKERRERHRCFLEALVRKGVVPCEVCREVELTGGLIWEIVSVAMEWAEKEDERLYTHLLEWWYVNPEAKHVLLDDLRTKYGGKVKIDVEFIGEVFEEIEPDDWYIYI